MHSCVVILGPTASGKSSLGVELAKRHHGVVISADSRQVYRGLDIGTAKITQREMDGVPHYLLDVASPRGQYSVSRYVRDVRRVLKTIPESTPIFLVGGSAFYIKAVTQLQSFSTVPPNVQLRRRLDKKTTIQLAALLQKKDPARFQTIDRSNRRRLIRAIEITLSATQRAAPILPELRVIKLGLNPQRQQLFTNIDQRVDQRWTKMVNEVRRLHSSGLSWKKLDSFGLEYRFVGRYVRGLLKKHDALAQLKSASHDFTKRQMTWWKRDQDIHWVTPIQAAAQTRRFLRT